MPKPNSAEWWTKLRFEDYPCAEGPCKVKVTVVCLTCFAKHCDEHANLHWHNEEKR